MPSVDLLGKIKMQMPSEYGLLTSPEILSASLMQVLENFFAKTWKCYKFTISRKPNQACFNKTERNICSTIVKDSGPVYFKGWYLIGNPNLFMVGSDCTLTI